MIKGDTDINSWNEVVLHTNEIIIGVKFIFIFQANGLDMTKYIV